jgi:hypothetical protein
MMVWILAETDELLLLCLSVPLDDTLILRARVDVLAGEFEGSDAEGVSLVLNGLLKALDCIPVGAFLIEFVLLPQLG